MRGFPHALEGKVIQTCTPFQPDQVVVAQLDRDFVFHPSRPIVERGIVYLARRIEKHIDAFMSAVV
jgi:hypothetical protein